MRKEKLTGRFCHKKTLCGLVIWVEYYEYGVGWETDMLWRKAAEEDLVEVFENKFGS